MVCDHRRVLLILAMDTRPIFLLTTGRLKNISLEIFFSLSNCIEMDLALRKIIEQHRNTGWNLFLGRCRLEERVCHLSLWPQVTLGNMMVPLLIWNVVESRLLIPVPREKKRD